MAVKASSSAKSKDNSAEQAVELNQSFGPLAEDWGQKSTDNSKNRTADQKARVEITADHEAETQAGTASASDFRTDLNKATEELSTKLVELIGFKIPEYLMTLEGLTASEHVLLVARIDKIIESLKFIRMPKRAFGAQLYNHKSGQAIMLVERIDQFNSRVIRLEFTYIFQLYPNKVRGGKSLHPESRSRQTKLDEFKAAADQAFSSSGLPLELKSEFTRRVLKLPEELLKPGSQPSLETARPLFRPKEGELFANRPKGEDAIRFYVRVWAPHVSSGRAFLDDIEAVDPTLPQAVVNRCNYLARKNSKPAADFRPEHFPPQRLAMIAPNETIERQRRSNRERQARLRERRVELH